MRSTFPEVLPVSSALFILSVLSPEPDHVQGCNSPAGFPAVVERDAACALCGGLTLAPDGYHGTGGVLLLAQARFRPSVFIAQHLCRAPPSRFSVTSQKVFRQ